MVLALDAVPVPSELSKPKTLAGFDFTHQIRREIFEQVRDDTNYTVDQDPWVSPELPGELHTARWSQDNGTNLRRPARQAHPGARRGHAWARRGAQQACPV